MKTRTTAEISKETEAAVKNTGQKGLKAPVESKRIEQRTERRGFVILALFLVLASFIAASLFRIQIVSADQYRERVRDQLTVETKVNPVRGTITDVNGTVLATNISTYTVIISPQDIIDACKPSDEGEAAPVFDYEDESGRVHTGEKMNEMIAAKLSGILGVDKDFVLEKAALKGRRYEVITKGVSEQIADRLRAFISEYKLTNQIYLRATPKRYYPFNELAAHVIGFTDADGVGIYGLEKYYNEQLEGTAGRYITAQDARANDMPFNYESYVEAKDGYTVETTLDVNIQLELENQLRQTYTDNGSGERVCGIVMNVNTGAVLAMATYPTFDLNDPRTLDEQSLGMLSEYTEGTDEYEQKRMELLYRMWSNKAVTGLYEPGSTFKPITSTMAFEENVLNETDVFFCAGSYKVDGYPQPISCHYKSGHGAVTFAYGLQQSCNPTLIQVAQRVGIDRFYDYFRSFGYTEKTGIDLPAEAAPIYSSPANFSGVSLAVYSFGQTFKVTPIQQIDALAAVANGGKLVTPHLISRILDKDGNTVYSYETSVRRSVASKNSCDRVTKILEEGVSGDGGAKNCYVLGYKVAGKTGTSEKLDKYDENGARPYRVGSAMGYAPADDPEVIALILNDEPTNGIVYGSQVAAPYISGLLKFTLPYLNYEPEYTDTDLAALEMTVGSYVGESRESAQERLNSLELRYEMVGEGETVTAQVPEAGTKILRSGAKIILYFGDEAVTETVSVPDLNGTTLAAASSLLESRGLNVSFSGTQSAGAVVTSQSIEAGVQVPPGTVVEVTILHTDGTD